ncbi:MAG TPA: hypothetical protein VNH46_02210 [Gemmatimonadales bacterium]|nr:hypothetical protein [Gemmatimonadales bacterium]
MPDSVLANLSLVGALALDPDGSVYLADRRLPAILQLEPSGALRRVIGRPGGGPGEFNSVLTLGLHSDSLWALDAGLVRVTFFPREGGRPTTVPYGMYILPAPNLVRPQVRRGIPYTVLPDGGFLVQDVERSPEQPWSWPVSTCLLRTTRRFEVLDTLLQVPRGHSGMAFVYEDGESHFAQPFGDDPIWGTSSDGSVLVLVTRPAARNGEPSRFTVTAWRDGHIRLYSHEVSYLPRRLPRAAVDSMVEQLVAPGGPDMPRTPITADSIRHHLYVPEFYPPVADVVAARDGTTWLRVRFGDGPRDRGEWVRLSSHGYPMQRVTTPLDFSLLEADGHMLYGVQGAEGEIPHPVRYRIPPLGS